MKIIQKFQRRTHVLLLVGMMITVSSCGLFQKAVEAAFPLLGTWTMNSLELTLEYKNQINYRSGPYANTVIANRLLDFGTDNVTMGGTSYGYRREKVNGVNKVIFIDKSTNKDAFVFIYTLSGNSLTLTSENFLTGNTAQERVSNAKAWAAVFGIGLSKFAYLTNATDASSAIFSVKATKN
ncbi:hypothetical protein [Runella sp.]|uniref:hypothetical protein n=1 Tax=Runella sp. TaxID=1960881 RepID=UPI003D0E8492